MQAQKVLGNKWTEIAKVVSGRCVFLLYCYFLQGEKRDKNEFCELRFYGLWIFGFVYNRTDNAVKNRFSTLCKRRAKDEELYQENGVPCSNTNAKRVLTETGCLTPGGAGSLLHIKQMRYVLRNLLHFLTDKHLSVYILFDFLFYQSCYKVFQF